MQSALSVDWPLSIREAGSNPAGDPTQDIIYMGVVRSISEQEGVDKRGGPEGDQGHWWWLLYAPGHDSRAPVFEYNALYCPRHVIYLSR